MKFYFHIIAGDKLHFMADRRRTTKKTTEMPLNWIYRSIYVAVSPVET